MLIHHINMRILFTIFINIMVFGNLISQNSFYIVPSINSKVGISSTNGFDHFSKNYPSNDFFQVINKSFHYFPSINFGLRSEEHTSELQSRPHLVCRLLLEKKK